MSPAFLSMQNCVIWSGIFDLFWICSLHFLQLNCGIILIAINLINEGDFTMKMNKTNLAFGTLFCAATLSSMLMAHSSMVHADTDDADMQGGAAAMQFDEDTQNDMQTAQVRSSVGQTVQDQNISTVYSADVNEQRHENNVVHGIVQHVDTVGNAVNSQNDKSQNIMGNADANENKQQNVKNEPLKPNKIPLIIKNITDDDQYRVHFVDRYGREIDKLNIKYPINDQSMYTNKYEDVNMRSYGAGWDYHVANMSEHNSYEYQINHSTRDVQSSVVLRSNVGSVNLTMGQSQHLFDLINKDAKSKSVLMDWSTLNSYDDFSNYLRNHDVNSYDYERYYLTLGFPHDDKQSALDARKAENMVLIGSSSNYSDQYEGYDNAKNRLTNSKISINIGKEDPKFAQSILNQLTKQIDANIVNGTQDIGTDSFEKYDKDILFAVKSRGVWKQNLYTFKDLTGMAYRDKNNSKQIDVPIWEPKTVKKQYDVTRIIQINFPDGVVPQSYYDICNRHGIIKQRLEYKDITTTDGITGDLISHGLYNGYNDDEPVSGFSEITLPKIPGYTLHIHRVVDKA